MTSLLFISAAIRESKDETALTRASRFQCHQTQRRAGTGAQHWRGVATVEQRDLHVALISIVCKREDDPCKCRVASPKA